MRGRKKTYAIVLPQSEEAQLRAIVAARNSPQGQVLRAKILLTCWEHADYADQQVAAEVGCSAAMVRKWRKRWHATHSLKELPRSGRPRVFSP
jgi:transposase